MTKLRTVFFLAALAGCTAFAADELPQPDQIIPYKQFGDLTLTLHVFNPPGHKAGDKTPAIVFFFGGGWVNGQPSQFYQQSAYLASRGMVAICADYRTRSKYQTPPADCVKDGKSAMRWVRSHATELGIDPNKLAAGGGSAGGHVAAATAIVKGFNEDGEDTSVSCRPDALVLFNPVIDNGPTGYGYERVEACWPAFSPIENIDKANPPPPTIFQIGTEDKLIPVATAERYKKLTEDAGVRCELRLYEGQPHGFFNKAKYNETLLEVDKFLTSLGYLKGSPTLTKE
ncbi:MAG: alpha/beta hydrolase fold domain-containing protein [Kiritimatiellales bacterium]